jgi:hypothetical protein
MQCRGPHHELAACLYLWLPQFRYARAMGMSFSNQLKKSLPQARGSFIIRPIRRTGTKDPGPNASSCGLSIPGERLFPVTFRHNSAGCAFSPVGCVSAQMTQVISNCIAVVTAGSGASYLCTSFPGVKCVIGPINCGILQALSPVDAASNPIAYCPLNLVIGKSKKLNSNSPEVNHFGSAPQAPRSTHGSRYPLRHGRR